MNLEGERFEVAYRRQLERLDVDELGVRFQVIARDAGKPGVVCLCYEDVTAANAWCHRTIFADHWASRTGAAVHELFR